MGDKDKPFSFGDFKLGILDGSGFKKLPIEEDSVMCECDEMSVREMAQPNYTAGSYSFNLDNDSIDKAQLDKLLCIDMQSQIDRAIESSVVVQCGEYILRPKNLKYPNKKRAMRIWKKWRKRFGVCPSKQFVIPRAVISFKSEFKNNQLFNTVEILAEKISE